MRLSCLAIGFILMCLPAWGATYYIDATGGNDSNSGTATNIAWKTISKVNGTSFSAGEQILFKRGETWREQLIVSSSGSVLSPITLGAYGTGEDPIITGYDLVNSVEVAIRDYCILITGDNYINIKYLQLRGALKSGLYINNGEHIQVEKLTIEKCKEYGIYHRSNPPGAVTGLTIVNCTIQNIGTGPDLEVFTSGGILAVGVDNVNIKDNIINTTHGPGVRVTAHDIESNIAGTQVLRNSVSGATNSIYLFRTIAPKVYRNHVFNGRNIGIFIGKGCDGAEVYYNIIHNLTHIPGTGGYNGIDINSAAAGKAYNNTIYKVSGACLVIDEAVQSADNWSIKNNIFHAAENSDPGTYASTYTMWVSKGVTGTTSDYNCHYFPSPGNEYGIYIAWGGNVYKPDQWSAFVSSEGQDAHSKNSDPKFVNSAEADFHLQFDSPVINSGTNVFLYTDYAGNEVPIDAAPDIGAYEYQGKSPTPNPPSNIRITY